MAFCVSCGRALVDGARFCSGCGRDLTLGEPEAAPLVQTVVLAAPTPTPGLSAIPTWSATPAAPPTASPPEQPGMWSTDLASAATRVTTNRRAVNARLLALIAGVCVLGLVGYLVISGLLGRGAAGAGSPEDAVKSFVTALQSKDAAAVAAALDPNEERQLVPLVTQVQQTAETGGVTHKGQELAGVEVTITDVAYDTKNLSDRVARVDITGGKITVAGVDKSKLPLALQGLTVDPSSSSVDLGKPIHTSYGRDVRPFVMAVKEDRGWFVSPLFTGAELLAQRQGVLGSYADTLPTATTEKTADDAVKQFLKAIASKDPDAVLTRLAPQEQSVARTYDRLWRPYLNEAMGSDAWNATNLQVSVRKMTDTDLGDGSTGVAIGSADVAVSNNNGSDQYSLEKDCVQSSGNGAQCLKSFRSSILFGFGGDGGGQQQSGTTARATVVAVKTDDGYAVSLLGSAAATGRSALAALGAKEVFRAVGMEFLLPTGGNLGVNQQLTIDASSTDNVTLTVDKNANVVLKTKGVNSLQLWNASGSPVYATQGLDASTGMFDESYELTPGQYRITWSKDSIPDNEKITITATTK